MEVVRSTFNFFAEINLDLRICNSTRVLIFGPDLDELGPSFINQFKMFGDDDIPKYYVRRVELVKQSNSQKSIRRIIELIKDKYRFDWDIIYLYQCTKTLCDEFAREWPDAKIVSMK